MRPVLLCLATCLSVVVPAFAHAAFQVGIGRPDTSPPVPVWTSAQDDYQVGIGRADITPPFPIWMSGYGGRNKPSVGVDHPLYVKALALRSGDEARLLLLSADILGFDRALAEEIAGRIHDKHGLP